MTQQELLLAMDDLLELPPGSLKGSEALKDLEQWNSMAVIGFIAMADTNGARVSARQIATCSTVAELLTLAQPEGVGK
jgi:acyl carrier protein